MEMQGRVRTIRLSPKSGEPQRVVETVQAIPGGLEGDHHCDIRSKRQISMIDQSMLDELSAEIDMRIEPGMIRENIVTEGLELETLEEGTRLQLGEAIIEVTKARTPCAIMSSVHPDLRQKMEGRAGIMARVVQPGTIQTGDQVQVLVVT